MMRARLATRTHAATVTVSADGIVRLTPCPALTRRRIARHSRRQQQRSGQQQRRRMTDATADLLAIAAIYFGVPCLAMVAALIILTTL